jgi:hypothetical protein
MNIPYQHDRKVLNKMLSNWIQQHTNRIFHHDQMRFVSGLQGWLCVQNWSKQYITLTERIRKKPHAYLVDWKNAFDKVQHPFTLKMLNELGMDVNYSNIIKSHTFKSPCEHTQGWKTKKFSSKIWNWARMPSFNMSVKHSTRISSQSN